MNLDAERLLTLKIPDSSQSYNALDAMRYALSLGLGADPLDAQQLRFVYEPELRVLPSMGVVLAHPGFWPRTLDTGLDWVRILHADQNLVMHRPLPDSAVVRGQARVVDVIDKGPGRGALVVCERLISDAANGEPLCTSTYTMFCRGDGGFGGPPRTLAAPHAVPEREPDAVCDLPTLPQTALLYRLNGDMNPLHADPQVARAAGFERPVLHGLATFGIACHAVLRSLCDYEPARLKSMFGRFTAPVYPGETLRTRLWLEPGGFSFTVEVPERGVVAINNGNGRFA
jgi:acyl dehydratase